jgi:hypothetical protein
MQAWSQFYSTIGAASAALLGLLFVAVSINAPAALGPDQDVSRRLTEQAFQNFMAVMFVSLLTLFPGIEPTTFGWVALAVTAGWSAWVFIRFGQTLVSSQALVQRAEWRSWSMAVRRHLSSLIGFTILLVVTLRMALNWDQDYNWLAASMLVLLFSATTVSWELLTRIAKRKAE